MLEQYLNSLREAEIKQLFHVYIGDDHLSLNKTKMVQKLVSFFTPDTISTLLSSLSDEENLIISSIKLKKECTLSELEQYTHLATPVLLNHLYYLKLKLLVIETGGIYTLNDVFNIDEYISYHSLFKSKPYSKSNHLIDRNTIIGILNYFYSNPCPSHGPHLEKYLKSTSFSSIFPRLNGERVHDLGKYILNYLLSHDELELEDGHYILRANCFLKYLKLNTISLLSLFLFDKVNEETINFLTLLSRLGLIEKSKGEECLKEVKTLLNFDQILSLSNLFLFNVITEQDEGLNLNCEYQETYSNFIQYNSDLSAYYQGELSLSSILPLIASCEKVDTLTLYTLNKQCFTKALDHYSSLDELVTMIKNDSSSLPSLIISRFDSWNEAYERISFVEGVVMYMKEAEAKVIDNLPLLQIHILKRLAPTVYLMKRETQGQWRRILLYAGFENLSAVKSEKEEEIIEVQNYLPRDKKPLNDKKHLLPTLDTNSLNPLIKNHLIITEEQVKTLKNREANSVFPFDVKAKLVLLESLLKQPGRDVLVSFTDYDFYAIVLDVYKENSVAFAKLYNLDSKEVITTAVSKIYTLTLV